MASYAAELYQDDEAVRYAARAVELSPDDAEGHKKLGEMYRKRQDVAKSISEFRQAIRKNERLFAVYLELAELLLGQGEADDADMLLRRVIRASPDEELVSQAARLSMQVNLGRGTLESLEHDLLPLALNSPERPIYRQLLLEVYGALAYPLLEREKSDRPKEAEAARVALDRLGERAVKPLLDALGDAREAEQEVAITLLSTCKTRAPGPRCFVRHRQRGTAICARERCWPSACCAIRRCCRASRACSSLRVASLPASRIDALGRSLERGAHAQPARGTFAGPVDG